MPAVPRSVVAALFLLAVFSSTARSAPIGIFDASVDTWVEIVFQFAPTGAAPPRQLNLGLASSLVPPSPGYLGCTFQLYDAGGLISSSTINSIFGCQGIWEEGDGSGVSLLIDDFVDLSGIAAGQTGTIRMRPLFLGPGGVASLDSPGLFFTGAGTVTILSQTVVPEPSTLALCLGGASALAAGRRRLRRAGGVSR